MNMSFEDALKVAATTVVKKKKKWYKKNIILGVSNLIFMAKSWKPKLPKPYSYKPPKPFDPFKPVKQEPQPHIITLYERDLINKLAPYIKAKHLIRFWYNDKTTDFQGWRTIEPHLIGQTKFKHANIWLVGWFLPTAEQMLDGHEQKWGNYILEDVQKVEILEQTYRHARIGYNPQDKRMIKIYCATL